MWIGERNAFEGEGGVSLVDVWGVIKERVTFRKGGGNDVDEASVPRFTASNVS